METNSSTSNSKYSSWKMRLVWFVFLVTSLFVFDKVIYETLFVGIDGSYRIVRGLGKSEVLVVGSSHVTWDIDDAALASKLSQTVSRIGVASADIRFRIAVVDEYLRQNPPRLILVEVDDYVFHPERYRIPKEVTLPYWHKGLFHNISKEVWGNEFSFKVARVSRAFSVNTEYTSFLQRVSLKLLPFYLRLQSPMRSPSSGTVGVSESADAKRARLYQSIEDSPEQIDPRLLTDFENFLKFASGLKSKVVLIETPNIRVPGVNGFVQTQEIITELSKKYGITFLYPFRDQETEASWFHDATHLTPAGSQEYTNRLLKMLKDGGDAK